MTEPMPRPGRVDVFKAAHEVLDQRAKQGMETYGRPLESFNGRNPARDALEEAADQFVYLIQLCEERQFMVAWMASAYEFLAELNIGHALRAAADEHMSRGEDAWR